MVDIFRTSDLAQVRCLKKILALGATGGTGKEGSDPSVWKEAILEMYA